MTPNVARIVPPLSSTARLLATAGVGLAVCGMDGEPLILNEALRTIIENDGNEEDFAAALSSIARTAAEEAPADPLHRALSRDGHCFNSAALVEDGAVLVILAPAQREEVDLAAVGSSFGLSEMQARTALLLARRLSNREIAASLGISPHTARHHTERVLRKLGVRSRKDVAGALGFVDLSAT